MPSIHNQTNAGRQNKKHPIRTPSHIHTAFRVGQWLGPVATLVCACACVYQCACCLCGVSINSKVPKQDDGPPGLSVSDSPPRTRLNATVQSQVSAPFRRLHYRGKNCVTLPFSFSTYSRCSWAGVSPVTHNNKKIHTSR